MYPRNAASPEPIAIGAVVQISDGAVQTSGCTVRIKPVGVAEGDGGGTTAYSTDGVVLYTPTQAETNYTSFVLIAKKTGCIPVAVTVVTSASATAGYVGTDQGKIANATSTVNLSNTTIKAVTDRVTANVDQIGGNAQSVTDLKDFADTGYDPATHKVTGVVLTDTTTTLTNLPSIPANWITAAGITDGAFTAAKFGVGALDAVWSTGTRTLTGFGTLAADTATAVWGAGSRTLTGFGTLIADIWNAAPIDFTALSAAVNAIGTIVTTINSKIGAFTGSGINTILGFFQALMRNDVSIPSDVGGTYNDADHSLQALAVDIAAINVSGGTGARVVTITVNDGTSPLENAKVRAYLSASENYVLSSNASGVVVFNLDDGTWTISITKPGYSFTSQLLVVNGNESQTYSMTQEVVTPNPDPDKSTVTITCYDAKTELESGVKIYLEQMTIPTSSENIAFSGAAQEYISGVNGQIELTLWRNAKYRYRRGQEKDWIEFTPNSATYDVTSIVGY